MHSLAHIQSLIRQLQSYTQLVTSSRFALDSFGRFMHTQALLVLFMLLAHRTISYIIHYCCGSRTIQATGKRGMTKLKSKIAEVQAEVRKSVTVPLKSRGYFFRTEPGEYAAHDKFLGVTNPDVRAIAKIHKDLSLAEIQLLLDSEYNEERFLGLVVLTEQYKKADIAQAEILYDFYLSNLARVNNWNLVDTSAHLIVGPHLLKRDRSKLAELAQSEVLWERRVAVVSTLHFIRNKDFEWTLKLAEMLLNDEQDLMHKAVGWMLREMGKKDVSPLLAFLDKNAAVMPRTMLRYSLEKLTSAQKKHYMAKGHRVNV